MQIRHRGLVTVALLAPAIVLISAVLIWPLLDFVSRSFRDPGGAFVFYARLAELSIYFQVLMRTLGVSAATAFICLLIGYPVAYKLATAKPLGKALILACVLLPFWTNLLVRSYGWILILNPQGIINSALLELGLISAPLDIVYNFLGVLIGMSQIMLPYFILPLYAVMTKLDPQYANAARTLGARPLRTFMSVYFPLTLPGVMAGLLLVFTISLGFFVIPAMLGGAGGLLLAQMIEFNVNTSLNWGMASALSTSLLAATLVLYVIGDRWLNLGAIWGLQR
ncbi:MAG: ABC transporter permease [Pseudomonadota bacterium]|nr:ABC transporter permease [Pseudomonadota bacterium]